MRLLSRLGGGSGSTYDKRGRLGIEEGLCEEVMFGTKHSLHRRKLDMYAFGKNWSGVESIQACLTDWLPYRFLAPACLDRQ